MKNPLGSSSMQAVSVCRRCQDSREDEVWHIEDTRKQLCCIATLSCEYFDDDWQQVPYEILWLSKLPHAVPDPSRCAVFACWDKTWAVPYQTCYFFSSQNLFRSYSGEDNANASVGHSFSIINSFEGIPHWRLYHMLLLVCNAYFGWHLILRL